MPSSLQSQSASPADPLIAYEQCVKEEKLKNDEAQRLVIGWLQKLYHALSVPHTRRLIDKILPLGARSQAARSIYLWGDVGRGKSLLMDMFYAAAPLQAKQRTHFHALMTDVHAAIHAFRQQQKSENPVEHIARKIAEKTRLLCLDEFQVTDVADAMILSKLFTTLLSAGVTFVVTSNRPPEELYLGGLQRDKFMEFVDLVYARMDVLELASPHDYRMQQIRAMQAVYMWPLTKEADESMHKTFGQLTHGADLSAVTLEVQGRKLVIHECYGGIARLSFADLCEKPLGAADYLAIARRFHTLFLSGIPALSAEKRNEAKRFVTLVDTLYDHRVKLICTAAVAPGALYSSGDGTFEFQRTTSRLAEMQSGQYLSSPHIP